MAGLKLMTLAQWRQWAVGKHLDIDGAFGAQCWDLWADYAMRVHGAEKYSTWTSTAAGPDRGLASSLWLQFPARPGIEKQFTKIGRHETPRAGDVAVWARSRPYPYSHVAVATGSTKPGLIECVSQNDLGNANTAAGATRVAWLTTGGLLGYLRPKTSAGPTPTPTPTPAIGQEEDEEMKLWIADVAGSWYLIVATGAGKPNAASLPGDSGMGGGGAAKAGIPVIKFKDMAALRRVANA